MEIRERPEIYGILAEFDSTEGVLEATRRAYEAGYRKMEAYTPIPVDGLAEALGFKRNWVAQLIFLGGLAGGTGAFFMQWFSSVHHYPLNVGGRPLNSWPMFMPITFEATVLLAGLTAVFGMLALNGLPRPYHPIFNAPRFALASNDRFFLSIQGIDPQFNRQETAKFLEGLGAKSVSEVDY